MDHSTVALPPGPPTPTDLLSATPPAASGTAALPVQLPAHLKLVRRAGAGGMGVVWEAWDDRRAQRVALKLPRVGRPDLAQALRTEFRRAAEVVHPHLLGLYELHDLDGVPAMVMEWVEGQPLHGGLPPKALRRALGQVCEGVAALHAQGLVHHDIKPPNIMLRADGDAVLLDFGLAQADDEPRRGFGTPDYMAPELLEGVRASPASDVYALGVSAYELLGAELPFQGPLAVQRRAKRAGWASPLSERAPGLPSELCAVVMQALAAAPEGRPSLEALRSALDPSRTAAGAPLAPRSGLLRSALEAVVPGQPLALIGESGMGKTTLARSLRGPLGPRLWLRGSCSALAQVVFGGLDGLVDDLSRLLSELGRKGLQPDPTALRAAAALFPAMGPPGHRAPTLDPEGVLRGADGLAALIRVGASARPIGLFIDDVQWVDPDTAQVLSRVLSQLGPAVPVLLASRSAEAVRGVAPGAVLIEVGPLQPEELAEAGVAAPGQRLDEPVPPYAFAALTEQAGESGPALARWRGALLRRQLALPAPARELVRLLTLAAAPLQAHLSAGLGVPEPALRAAVAAALVRVEVSREGPSLRLSHPRLAEALGGAEAEAPALHLRLAEAFASTGALAAAAHHFEHGGRPSAAAPLYAEAGRAALAGGAWAQAAAQLERAEALGHVNPETSEALARAWLSVGRHREAVQKLRATAAGRPAVEAAPLLADAVWVEVGNGQLESGMEALRSLLRLVGEEGALSRASGLWAALRGALPPLPRADAPAPTPEDRARLAALWAAANAIAGLDPLLGLALHARHAAAAATVAAPDHHARALVGPLWDLRGRGAATQEIEARLAGLRPHAQAPDLESLIAGAGGFGRYLACEVAEARAQFVTGLAAAREAGGLGWVERFCGVGLLMCNIYREPVELLTREVELLLLDAEARGDRLGRLSVELAVGYQLELLGGGGAGPARRRLEAACAAWSGALPPELMVRRVFAEAHVCLAEHRPTEGLAALRRLGLRERPLQRYRVVRALRALNEARLRIALGGRDELTRARALASQLIAEATPTCVGWGEALRGVMGDAEATQRAKAAFALDGHSQLEALDGGLSAEARWALIAAR